MNMGGLFHDIQHIIRLHAGNPYFSNRLSPGVLKDLDSTQRGVIVCELKPFFLIGG